MSRVSPKSLDTLDDDLADLMRVGQEMMGFLPNDGLIMAHRPELVQGLVSLTRAAYETGPLSPSLKRMIGFMTSSVSGCAYCRSHTAHGAVKRGVEEAKLAAIWDYEHSPLFTPAERAALRIAHHAGVVPNAVTDEDFAAAREFYSDQELVDIVGVIALFGFLNRWNATLATEIEDQPGAALARVDALAARDEP